MDLVYEADRDMVRSKWNHLVQGNSVYFEMRVKRPGALLNSSENDPTSDSNDFQWIITACVPITDEDGNLVCIAGNTTDISVRNIGYKKSFSMLISEQAQKRGQTEALRKAQALESAEDSEQKLVNFFDCGMKVPTTFAFRLADSCAGSAYWGLSIRWRTGNGRC